MSDADRCVCCGEIIPEGVQVCPKCMTHQVPPTTVNNGGLVKPTPAKFTEGALVKLTREDKGVVYYNHVVDSYFNYEIQMRLYRLNERIAMPVYREDWLEAVSTEEATMISASGKLKRRLSGGWEYPLEGREVSV